MHRKAKMFPVGEMITGIVLMVLAAILAIGAIMLGQAPASAAWQNRSAVLLAQTASTIRPFWDGRHPLVWASDREPFCDWRYAYHTGIIEDIHVQERYQAECLPEGGEAGPWSWSLLP